MQIEISNENAKLFHELETLYRRKIPTYQITTTKLANIMLNEALNELVKTERKSK